MGTMPPIGMAAVVGLVGWQFMLYAAGWAVCAALLREERRAALCWSLFAVCGGLGMMLAAERGEPRLWWPYTGSSLLVLWSYVAAWFGLASFLRRPPLATLRLGGVAVLTVGLLWVGPGAETASWRVLLAYGGLALVIASAQGELRRAMVAEFGRVASLVLAAPAGALVVLFAVRATQQALRMEQPLEMHTRGLQNMGMLSIYLAGAAWFHFGFLALLVARLVRRLRGQAREDALTGLANRRAFEDFVARHWQRRAPHRVLALAVFDLDHFKAINDRLGHAAGDEVLRACAERMRRDLRQGDLLARIGGEEFVLVMPDTPLAAAEAVVARLRARLSEGPVAGGDAAAPPVRVTASAGLAAADAQDADWGDLLVRADEAMFRAKQAGRDRLEVATA